MHKNFVFCGSPTPECRCGLTALSERWCCSWEAVDHGALLWVLMSREFAEDLPHLLLVTGICFLAFLSGTYAIQKLALFLLLIIFRVQDSGLGISSISSNQIWLTWSYVLHSGAEGIICLQLSTYDLLSCGCLLTWVVVGWYLSWKLEVAPAVLFHCTGKNPKYFLGLRGKGKKHRIYGSDYSSLRIQLMAGRLFSGLCQVE